MGRAQVLRPVQSPPAPLAGKAQVIRPLRMPAPLAAHGTSLKHQLDGIGLPSTEPDTNKRAVCVLECHPWGGRRPHQIPKPKPIQGHAKLFKPEQTASIPDPFEGVSRPGRMTLRRTFRTLRSKGIPLTTLRNLQVSPPLLQVAVRVPQRRPTQQSTMQM